MADPEDQKEQKTTHAQPKRGRRFWLIGGLIVLFISGSELDQIWINDI